MFKLLIKEELNRRIKMEFLNKLKGFYKEKPAPINGAIAGLLSSITMLAIGFFRTIFIIASVIGGYILGRLFSKNKDFLTNLLERILPPGRF
jgi:uncharacterized membrane protein